MWHLVYGKNQHKECLPHANIDIYQDHFVYIKNLNLLAKCSECIGCKNRFNQNGHYCCHINAGSCTIGKTRVVYTSKKHHEFIEKVLYGGSQSAC